MRCWQDGTGYLDASLAASVAGIPCLAQIRIEIKDFFSFYQSINDVQVSEALKCEDCMRGLSMMYLEAGGHWMHPGNKLLGCMQENNKITHCASIAKPMRL